MTPTAVKANALDTVHHRGEVVTRLIRILWMDRLRLQRKPSAVMVSPDIFWSLVEYEFINSRPCHSSVLVLPEGGSVVYFLPQQERYERYLNDVGVAERLFFNTRCGELELKVDFFASPATLRLI